MGAFSFSLSGKMCGERDVLSQRRQARQGKEAGGFNLGVLGVFMPFRVLARERLSRWGSVFAGQE
jgi:hypothetical protein